MPALSGGDELEDERSPTVSVLERPDTSVGEVAAGLRSLDRIFPLQGDDATRARQMRETWRAFRGGMADDVRAALDGSRSPPEIAYAIGDLVHNYFRTRGVTLTSFELRRLVAEVLDLQESTGDGGDRPAHPEEDGHAVPPLVAFMGETAATAPPWTGGEPAAPVRESAATAFDAPPSALVSLPTRDAASFDRLLAAVVAAARSRLAAGAGGPADRAATRDAIDAVAGELLEGQTEALPAGARERLSLLALSELRGLGLIDRLWADRSVRAIVVNGPDAVYVERNGRLEPAAERFRDREHLLELVARLARPTPGGVVEFRLRDGSDGTLVLPPAAPSGPVMVLRRGDPGAATFERLIASDMLDRPIADLMRLAVRCRLNVTIAGPEGAGKTALLAAIARDFGGDTRVVTLARHRAFGWASSSKVELVASSGGDGVSFSRLLAASVRLLPDLLIVDSIQPEDVPVLGEVVSRGERAVVVALPESLAPPLERRADLAVRLGRGRDGLFRVISLADSSDAPLFLYENGGFHRTAAEPSFSRRVRDAGFGEALSSILR